MTVRAYTRGFQQMRLVLRVLDSLFGFDALLQSLVHEHEPTRRFRQGVAQKLHEEAGKVLSVLKARPPRSDFGDLHEMFAIEETTNQEFSLPAQLTVGVGHEHGGFELELAAARWGNHDLQLGALLELAGDLRDERIPLPVALEVGEHRPDGRRRRIDFDFRPELHGAARVQQTRP